MTCCSGDCGRGDESAYKPGMIPWQGHWICAVCTLAKGPQPEREKPKPAIKPRRIARIVADLWDDDV